MLQTLGDANPPASQVKGSERSDMPISEMRQGNRLLNDAIRGLISSGRQRFSKVSGRLSTACLDIALSNCVNPNSSTIPLDKMRVCVIVVLLMLLTIARSYPPRYARHRHRHQARHADEIDGRNVREHAGLPDNSATTASGTVQSLLSARADPNSTSYAHQEYGTSGTKHLKVEV